MSKAVSSKLLQPFRSVGYISDPIPGCLNTLGILVTFDLQLGTEHFFTVSCGKSFQVYKLDKLKISIISPQIAKSIKYLLFFYFFLVHCQYIKILHSLHVVMK